MRKIFLLTVVAMLTFPALIACGSGGSGASDSTSPANQNAASDAPAQTTSENSIIVNNGGIYTIDDFTTAGYKNVTHFELSELPEANDAWYGFFSQKDFELRFYESHEAALEHGVEPAEFAVGKGAVGYSKRPPLRFDAYAVVGNVVMLCELALESCENLIAQLPD